jgi:hypothetical protein
MSGSIRFCGTWFGTKAGLGGGTGSGLGAITRLGTEPRTTRFGIFDVWLVGGHALGFKSGDFAGRNAVANELLNATHFEAVTVFTQRDGSSLTSGAASTTNAVHVVFGLHRQVKVNGMADGLHVNAAGGNVGGYQNTDTATLHRSQCTGALTLVHVAVQGLRMETLFI